MSFDRDSFNRKTFNRTYDDVLYFSVSGTESVDASIGSNLYYYTSVSGYERVDETISGEQVRFLKATGSETVSKVTLYGDPIVYLVRSGTETVTSSVIGSSNYMTEIIGAETVSNSTAADINYILHTNLSETISSDTTIRANIQPPLAEGYELITESASLENIEIKTCVLNVTLKPGQTLIIDSSTYNVLLNSENAISIHSGDWIDELNRNTTEIRIDAASGATNLTGTILYTERYL